jgi:hypothetical protein
MTVRGDAIAGVEWLVDDRISYATARNLSPRVGAPYRDGSAPWRKVWHSVEGDPSTIAGARGLAIAHRTPPHLWAAPRLDWVGQTVPLNLAAYALKHPDGAPETNHRHAIQTEVFGFARDDMLRDPGIIRWLAARVLGPVLDAGVPINLSHIAPSDGSDAAGINGSVRLSWSWWASFDGQCAHQNVPGNEHWDAGRADYAAIAAATITEDDMPYSKAEMLALIEQGVWNAIVKGGDAEDSFEKRVAEGVEKALAVKLGVPGDAVDQFEARVVSGIKDALGDPEVVAQLRTALGLA